MCWSLGIVTASLLLMTHCVMANASLIQAKLKMAYYASFKEKKMHKLLVALIFVFCSSQIALGMPELFEAGVNPSVVEFQIIDPLGNITGYNPNTRTVIENIPNTLYWEFIVPGPEDVPPAKNEIYHKVIRRSSALPNINGTGIYKVKLFGTNTPENFEFSFVVDYMPLPNTGVGEKKGIIYPNVTWTYEFDVPANPPSNGQLVVVKVANSTDLITDINAANSVGHLGTPGTYHSLLAKAENAKAKLDAGQAQAAKNILNAFINEVTAQKGQQINSIAADILIEDAQYIISHN